MSGIDSSVAIAARDRSVPAVAGEGRALTEMQAAFVVAFTADPAGIGNPTAAAKLAGYAETAAKDLGRRLVALPHVQDAIRAANQQQISGQMATKAIALLGRVIEDETVSMKVRVDAARSILDRAGYSALPGIAKRPNDKQLAEMTAEELRETMRRARAEMDGAPRVLDGAAVPIPDAPARPIIDTAATVKPTTDAPEGTRK